MLAKKGLILCIVAILGHLRQLIRLGPILISLSCSLSASVSMVCFDKLNANVPGVQMKLLKLSY